MQYGDSIWLYPLILAAGALQAWGPPMNGALRAALVNPWLASLLITANFLMSLLIDKFGWFGMQPHELTAGRLIGGALMVTGIALISRF